MTEQHTQLPESQENRQPENTAKSDIELPVLNQKQDDKPTESGCCGACGG